jgi:glycosyltransferase involved in cell wall biosynthesis
MIRALHLIDADANYELTTTHNQLVGALGESFTVHSERVQENIASFMTTTLELRRDPDEQFDVIHAFGPYSLAVGLFYGSKVIYTASEFPRKSAIGWLRAAMNYRDLHVVCPTELMRQWMVRHGVPIERCHLIRPGVDFSKIKAKKDYELRKAFGFTPEDYVVLPGGETTHRAFHLYAVQATTILHWLDNRYKSLMWGRGKLTDSRAKFGTKLNLQGYLNVAERRMGRRLGFEELLPAVDLVLFVSHYPVPTLPIALTMASGVPIVSVAQRPTCEILEDRHNAFLAKIAHPRLIAKRILDMRDDPQLQWKVADMARTEAFEYFPQTRMLQQYRAIYSQLSKGERVELPQLTSDLGSRARGQGEYGVYEHSGRRLSS